MLEHVYWTELNTGHTGAVNDNNNNNNNDKLPLLQSSQNAQPTSVVKESNEKSDSARV